MNKLLRAYPAYLAEHCVAITSHSSFVELSLSAAALTCMPAGSSGRDLIVPQDLQYRCKPEIQTLPAPVHSRVNLSLQRPCLEVDLEYCHVQRRLHCAELSCPGQANSCQQTEGSRAVNLMQQHHRVQPHHSTNFPPACSKTHTALLHLLQKIWPRTERIVGHCIQQTAQVPPCGIATRVTSCTWRCALCRVWWIGAVL